MTPEQETQLLKDTRTARDTGLRIEERCKVCQEVQAAHTLELEGPPGNGDHPGIKARMFNVETSCKEIRKAQTGQVKWMRAQLGAVIAAFLAMIAKWRIWG